MRESNIKYFYLTIWLLFISFASLLPGNDIPRINIPHFDKIVHAGMYFILTIILIQFYRKKANNKYLKPLLLSILVGITFEILQKFITNGRSASFFDVTSNIAGAILGIAFFHNFIKGTKIDKFLFKIE